jgi:AcrR family transcriptional regulator
MAKTRSTRREKQAAATREDILEAARRLFAERGYAATSMSAIAEEAETAVQTIYDSVGPKRAIVLAMVELSEQKAGVPQYVKRIMEAQDPRECITHYVRMTRQFMEPGGDVFVAMMTAATTEPDVAEAWEMANRNHRHGARLVAGQLAKTGELTPGTTVEQAGAVLGVMTWGTTWLQFTRDHSWSFDECESWLIASLCTLLVKDAGPGPSPESGS